MLKKLATLISVAAVTLSSVGFVPASALADNPQSASLRMTIGLPEKPNTLVTESYGPIALTKQEKVLLDRFEGITQKNRSAFSKSKHVPAVVSVSYNSDVTTPEVNYWV